mmetsp:Transcript_16233/g.52894  ORF Transcript_16233/g.52894 Transcript_16233/m.52894 type:complete len:374 (-) Transcript_16233:956-2077(-)
MGPPRRGLQPALESQQADCVRPLCWPMLVPGARRHGQRRVVPMRAAAAAPGRSGRRRKRTADCAGRATDQPHRAGSAAVVCAGGANAQQHDAGAADPFPAKLQVWGGHCGLPGGGRASQRELVRLRARPVAVRAHAGPGDHAGLRGPGHRHVGALRRRPGAHEGAAPTDLPDVNLLVAPAPGAGPVRHARSGALPAVAPGAAPGRDRAGGDPAALRGAAVGLDAGLVGQRQHCRRLARACVFSGGPARGPGRRVGDAERAVRLRRARLARGPLAARAGDGGPRLVAGDGPPVLGASARVRGAARARHGRRGRRRQAGNGGSGQEPERGDAGAHVVGGRPARRRRRRVGADQQALSGAHRRPPLARLPWDQPLL